MRIKHLFDQYKLTRNKCKEGYRFLDPTRSIFLNITPEEIVRQKMLMYLQKEMQVPIYNIYTEDHLVHYGISDQNGRIDISLVTDEGVPVAVVECKESGIPIKAVQVYEQACSYAFAIGAPYIILVNGIDMLFYHSKNGFYQEIEAGLIWNDMLNEKYTEIEQLGTFERLSLEQYFDVDFIKAQEWAYTIIGEDTDESLIPFIANLSDALLDVNHRILEINSDRFKVEEDLGVVFRKYGDASGSTFGTGDYRTLLIKDLEDDTVYLMGFGICTTGKTVNDPKYGNSQGKSVLVVFRDDGKADEMSVQINLNKFVSLKNNIALITHNGVVTRKGARKEELLAYLKEKNSELVKNNRVYIGKIRFEKNIYLDDQNVTDVLKNLIEYSIYREEYKKRF